MSKLSTDDCKDLLMQHYGDGFSKAAVDDAIIRYTKAIETLKKG